MYSLHKQPLYIHEIFNPTRSGDIELRSASRVSRRPAAGVPPCSSRVRSATGTRPCLCSDVTPGIRHMRGSLRHRIHNYSKAALWYFRQPLGGAEVGSVNATHGERGRHLGDGRFITKAVCLEASESKPLHLCEWPLVFGEPVHWLPATRCVRLIPPLL